MERSSGGDDEGEMWKYERMDRVGVYTPVVTTTRMFHREKMLYIGGMGEEDAFGVGAVQKSTVWLSS